MIYKYFDFQHEDSVLIRAILTRHRELLYNRLLEGGHQTHQAPIPKDWSIRKLIVSFKIYTYLTAFEIKGKWSGGWPYFLCKNVPSHPRFILISINVFWNSLPYQYDHFQYWYMIHIFLFSMGVSQISSGSFDFKSMTKSSVTLSTKANLGNRMNNGIVQS